MFTLVQVLTQVYYLVPLALLASSFLNSIVYKIITSTIVLVILVNSWIIGFVKHKTISPTPWIIVLSILIGRYVYRLLAESNELIVFNTEYFLGLTYSIIGLGLMYYVLIHPGTKEYVQAVRRNKVKLVIGALIVMSTLAYISYTILLHTLRVPLFYVLVGSIIDLLLLISLEKDISLPFNYMIYTLYIVLMYVTIGYSLILLSLSTLVLKYVLGDVKRTLLCTYAIRIVALILSFVGVFMHGTT